MAGIAHLGLGLAAKPVAPEVPVGVLLLATEANDILWGAFALAGIENMQVSPWSHGLFMSVIWASAAGLLAGRIYRNSRTGTVIGLAVFSHWVLDFITHPMFGGPPDLPLLFNGSPLVGLGLYSRIGLGLAMPIELGMIALGLVVYLRARQRAAARAR